MIIFGSFRDFFVDVYGVEPYEWQCFLADRVATEGVFPSVVDVPTGFGKSAVVDVWVWCVLRGFGVPRRLVVASERRVLVSAGVERGAKLRAFCESRGLDVFDVVVWHGGVGAVEPLSVVKPTLVFCTVSQVGLGLLGRGVGVSGSTGLVRAGVLGVGSWVVVDEPQLAVGLTGFVGGLLGGVTVLSATVPNVNSARGVSNASAPFVFDVSVETGAHARELLGAERGVSVVDCGAGVDDSVVSVVEGWVNDNVLKSGSIAVVVNSVDSVHRVGRLLEKSVVGAGGRLFTVTGQTRGVDRPTSEQMSLVGSVTVGTQVIEAGVDYSVTHMVSELCPVPSLVQRFGRVVRWGGRGTGECIVVVPSDKDGVGTSVSRAVYGEDCLETCVETLGCLRGLCDSVNTGNSAVLFDDVVSSVVGGDTANNAGTVGVDYDVFKPNKKHTKQPDFVLTATNIKQFMGLAATINGECVYPTQPHPALLPEKILSKILGSAYSNNSVDVDALLYGVDYEHRAQCAVVWRTHNHSGEPVRGTVPLAGGEAVSIPLETARLLFRMVERKQGVVVHPRQNTVGSHTGLVWTPVVKERDIVDGDTIIIPCGVGGYTQSGVNTLSKTPVSDLSLLFALNGTSGSKATINYETVQSVIKYGASMGVKPETITMFTKLLDEAQNTPTVSNAHNVDTMSIMQWGNTTITQLEETLCGHGYTCIINPTLTGDPQFKKTTVQENNSIVVTLDEHLTLVGNIIEKWCSELGFDEHTTKQLVEAGYLHDVGKAHPQFQKALGNTNTTQLLAKSTGVTACGVGCTTPHDVDAMPLASTPLVEWLVGDHHGRLRGIHPKAPHITTRAIQLRHQLEKQYGVYGLLHLESILRTADWEASRKHEPVVVNPQVQKFIDMYLNTVNTNEGVPTGDTVRNANDAGTVATAAGAASVHTAAGAAANVHTEWAQQKMSILATLTTKTV